MSEGAKKRDSALEAMTRAHSGWVQTALFAIYAIEKGKEFTTDDLWDMGLPSPPEPRAMGAAIRQAERVGAIRPAGYYRTSKRKECRARPVCVWKRI